MIPPQIANVLPRDARDMLIAAAKIADEKQRRIAIDAAMDHIAAVYPQHLQPRIANEEN